MGRKKWLVAVAIVLITLCIGLISFSNKGKLKKYQIQSVSYPEQMNVVQDGDGGQDTSSPANRIPFYQQTMSDILAGGKGENVAYSPVNFYLCMAMLTEMTDGETQQQILDALGQKSVDAVRKQSKKMWQRIYEDNDISKCILGDSVWLNENISYEKDVLKILADNYYASAYQGKMGTKELDKTIQEWVNQMTGNALKEQADAIETDSDMLLMLLSTAYFYDQWSSPFAEENTEERTFYNADRSKTKCDFMNKVKMTSFYEKEHFNAVSLDFEHGKSMYIFLPTEGVILEEMIEQEIEDILHITSGAAEDGRAFGEVTLYLPKFDITTSHMDLIPTMKNMGVTQILEDADVSTLLGGEVPEVLRPIYLNKAEQSTRIAVDENGCSVASFTQMDLLCGSAMMKEQKECTIDCNRPFLFVISDGSTDNGIPVFAGVVNEL